MMELPEITGHWLPRSNDCGPTLEGRDDEMSGQIGGQARALPLTGFATLPLVVIGLALSALGMLRTKLRSKKTPG
jgi:hypothetical protein